MTTTMIIYCRMAEWQDGRKGRSKGLLPFLSAILPFCHSAISEALLGDLERPEQRARLVARLLVLSRRIRVHHDPRAGLHVRLAFAHDHRPDRDAEIEVT